MNYRILLELSARAEENYWMTHDETWLDKARNYLDRAIQAPKQDGKP